MENSVAVVETEKKYIRKYSKENVEVKVSSPEVFKEMREVSEAKRYTEERVEFYDDEYDLSALNWMDVEGETYGWLWLRYPARKMHSVIRKRMLNFIRTEKELMTSDNYKEKHVVIIKIEDLTIYHFIDRDDSYSDTVYTFSNNILE